MTISQTDIVFTFSGGGTNSDPTLSLGGEPSNQPILGIQLFPDITEAQSKSGFIDYRCFYLHNQNTTDPLYDSKLYISYTVPGDVTVELGFYSHNERQNITVLNAVSVTSGSFVLTYTDTVTNYPVTVNWNASSSVWGTNLQTALRTIPNLEDVTVSTNISGSDLIFEVDFSGNAALRYHDIIALTTNSLSPTTSVGITRSVAGGPINSVAPEIDVSTTAPNGITFLDTSFDNPFIIGDIRALDSIPVWGRRTVPPNSTAIANDGFTFELSGNPIS